MYQLCFIMVCIVHFLSHDITFFYGMTYDLRIIEGKIVIFLNLQSSSPPSMISSLIAVGEAPYRSPPPILTSLQSLKISIPQSCYQKPHINSSCPLFLFVHGFLVATLWGWVLGLQKDKRIGEEGLNFGLYQQR